MKTFKSLVTICLLLCICSCNVEKTKENTLHILVVRTDSSFFITNNEDFPLRRLNIGAYYNNEFYMNRIEQLPSNETEEYQFKYFSSGKSYLNGLPDSFSANCTNIYNPEDLDFFIKF